MSDDLKLDLSKYKSPQIASKLAEILAVPKSIRTVVGTTFLTVLLLLIANSMLYAVVNGAWIPWLLSSIYATAVAIVLGFALGLIRVAGQLVSNSECVLQLTLAASQEVSRDLHAVRSGEKRMPTATEIVAHVYDDVVLPAMEASVAGALGVVGVPLLWIYRRTIGGCVRLLITRMKTSSLTLAEQNAIEHNANELVQAVDDNGLRIESTLQRALGYTQYATMMLRRVLLNPLQIVFILVALIAVIPLLLCWYWAGHL